MALVIRMRQQGRKNRRTFRLVVTDARNPRDGKYLESLGFYNPHVAHNPLQLHADRLAYWIGCGAQMSERAEQLAKNAAPEVIQKMKDQRNEARRKRAVKRRLLKRAQSKNKNED